jgi:hypothetical protein
VVAVTDSSGKLIMESILETEAATILQFFAGLRGNLSVTFEGCIDDASLASSCSISFESNRVCLLSTTFNSNSRARPCERSLARIKIVVSRTIFTGAAIAGTCAFDGLGEDLVGFLCGTRFAAGVHFGEILPQLLELLLPPLFREGRGLNSTDADSLICQYAAS